MTDMIKTDEPLLKTDGLGRVKTPPERREQLLDEFERSGLSGAKFAELTGIKYQTFAAWVARRRKQRGLTESPVPAVNPVRWLEAVVTEAKTPGSNLLAPVRLRLPNGACIELSDLNQVSLAAALAQALAKAPAPC